MKIVTLHNEPEKRHAIVGESGSVIRAFIHRYDALNYLDFLRETWTTDEARI